MVKKYFSAIVVCIFFFGTINFLEAQQNVFSRGEVTTGNFGDAQLPWFYQNDNNSQGDPDNGNTTRNFVKIGHNNNTTMTTNGRFYQVNTLDFEAGATSARTINNSGGGLSASGGIYNASSATHTFNTPIGIDGGTVQLHANSSGGLTFNDNIFINANTVEFGNSGTGVIIVTGTMSGAGNVSKVGSNTLAISGSNTYTGTTTIFGGVLILQSSLLNSDVIVKTGATLEIDGSVNVKSITVEAGGHIKINSGNTLTITDDITLESSPTSYSSLISDGTIVGTVSYMRHVNIAPGQGSSTTANDLISPPLSGMTFGDLTNANSNILSGTIGGGPLLYLFGPFDNGTANNFVLYEDGTDDAVILDTGTGYRTGSTGPDMINGGTYTFTGGVETGSVAQSITTPTGGSIWNLIGNPYPSYITFGDFWTTNNSEFDSSSGGLYGYDGDTSDGWIIYNGFTDPATLIAPGQGFFVASKSGGGTVTFNPSIRSSGSSNDFIPRANRAITKVTVNLSNTNGDFNTEIYFSEFSSLGLDPGYDATLFGGNAPSFSIYSELVEENMGLPFAIQGVGETDYEDVTIALGVNANQGEQIVFSMTENTIPSTVDVYLDDNLLNNSTLLNSSDYVLTPNTNLSGSGRFYLRFNDSALSSPENDIEDISIYANQQNRSIVISGQLLEDTVAHVYDIQGRLVTSKELNSNSILQTIEVNTLSTGVYVVRLSSGNLKRTEKIILN